MEPLLKILWIEDQPAENAAFVRDCAMEGFDLVKARTAEDGIRQLKRNPESFSGIILDALGFKKDTDEAIKSEGLYYATREIYSILPDIPRVIFTGQEKLLGNEEFQESVDIPVFYKHGDNEALFEELKRQIDNRPFAELRRRYQYICELCDDEFLPSSKWSETLYPALKEVHEGTFNPDRYTSLRKILEASLKTLCKNGILPADFTNGSEINLKYCELLMSGRSVTPHQQQKLHYYSPDPLIDKTDRARLALLKTLTSEESHDNLRRRNLSDLACAVFTLVSFLPSLKSLSHSVPTWKMVDTGESEYKVQGEITKKNFFTAIIHGFGRVNDPSDLIKKGSFQPGDKVEAVCRSDSAYGQHQIFKIRLLQ